MKRFFACVFAFAIALSIFAVAGCGSGNADGDPVMHTVTFNTDGGSEIAPVQVEDGKTVAEPEKPVKDGCTFVQWNYLSEKYDFSLPVTTDLVLVAVWESDGQDQEDQEPVYEDNGERMMITMWNEPRPISANAEKALEVMAQSGINTYVKWSYDQSLTEYCEKYGLDYMPHVRGVTPQGNSVYLAPDRISDAVTGFLYQDEPTYSGIDALESLAENHVQYYSDRLFFSNLFPEHDDSDTGVFGGHTYEEYVAHFCDTVYSIITENRLISVDCYPLYADGRIRTQWLTCYEVIAKYAKQYDADFHFYVANTQHSTYRALDLENLRFLVNVAMTYGANALGYFTYQNYEDGWGDGLVEEDGITPTETYYYAQQVNSELLSWDHVFLNFEWDCTMALEGASDGENPCFAGLQYAVDSIDALTTVAASEDTLIGRFTGKDGEVGLMFTNFRDPEDNKTDTVTMFLKDAQQAVVYVNGERTVVEAVGGMLTLSIAPGGAAFVIPF